MSLKFQWRHATGLWATIESYRLSDWGKEGEESQWELLSHWNWGLNALSGRRCRCCSRRIARAWRHTSGRCAKCCDTVTWVLRLNVSDRRWANDSLQLVPRYSAAKRCTVCCVCAHLILISQPRVGRRLIFPDPIQSSPQIPGSRTLCSTNYRNANF